MSETDGRGDVVRAAVEAGVARLGEAGRGVLYVCGPAGSGRSAVLAGIAAADPGAVLVDAAGRGVASVADELAERAGLFGGPAGRPAGPVPRAGQFRTVLVANAHLAGPYVDGPAPPGCWGSSAAWPRPPGRAGCAWSSNGSPSPHRPPRPGRASGRTCWS
ncbi:hypothetical protein ACIQBJ_15505 [Kitasatospora sp. NPDC088391]|uniref:hypothetical protein n=1 Tax=Kitasatospora sp. NPDC088391 TaxID=3364074 RepID=UPI003801E293